MRLVRGGGWWFTLRVGAPPAVQRTLGCRWYFHVPGLFVLSGAPAATSQGTPLQGTPAATGDDEEPGDGSTRKGERPDSSRADGFSGSSGPSSVGLL